MDYIVIVAPKQKVVRIYNTFYKGKRRKQGELIKTYKFKEDVPMIEVEKEVTHYDYGAWSVSEQEWTEKIIVKEYDQNVIESIRARTLKYFLQEINKP